MEPDHKTINSILLVPTAAEQLTREGLWARMDMCIPCWWWCPLMAGPFCEALATVSTVGKGKEA